MRVYLFIIFFCFIVICLPPPLPLELPCNRSPIDPIFIVRLFCVVQMKRRKKKNERNISSVFLHSDWRWVLFAHSIWYTNYKVHVVLHLYMCTMAGRPCIVLSTSSSSSSSELSRKCSANVSATVFVCARRPCLCIEATEEIDRRTTRCRYICTHIRIRIFIQVWIIMWNTKARNRIYHQMYAHSVFVYRV